MKDPHIHVEKDLLFTHAQMRGLIADAIGLAVNAPKTVSTGCNRRRPYAMTSTDPERVTCLACREHAMRYYEDQATLADALLAMPGIDTVWAAAKITPAGVAAEASKHRSLAARFRAMP